MGRTLLGAAQNYTLPLSSLPVSLLLLLLWWLPSLSPNIMDEPMTHLIQCLHLNRVCLSVCPMSACPMSACLSACLSVCLSLCAHLPVNASVGLSVGLSVYLLAYLPDHLSRTFLCNHILFCDDTYLCLLY